MSKFSEGACVALKNDNTELGLSAGATGTVWALYETEPPAYEVTFPSGEGAAFDALMYEDELEDELVEPAHLAVTEAPIPARPLASA